MQRAIQAGRTVDAYLLPCRAGGIRLVRSVKEHFLLVFARAAPVSEGLTESQPSRRLCVDDLICMVRCRELKFD